MLNEEQLKELASQLSHPVGDNGIATGKQMEITNANMILSAINALQLTGKEAVLEIGFGNGTHIPLVLQYGGDVKYTGVDISETMQQEALRYNAAVVAEGKAQFIVVDGTHLPFAANSFDRIFTVNTIYFWKDPAFYLSEIYRVLKQHAVGTICFAEKSFMQQLPFVQYGFNLFDKENVEDLLVTAGFIQLQSTVLTEHVTSNNGESIERSFIVARFVKP